MASSWDPMSADWKKQTPSSQCLMRIRKDLMAVFNEPSPGIFIIPDEADMTLIHALISGPCGTPYENGFFYLLIRCPPNYPIKSPCVKLMTTGEGKVRFNPNLYEDGKVCLSILGTWPGPCWSPALSLSSVLISIQSLLNENPYFNEPGFEARKKCSASDLYNRRIKHETLRVAVCDMLEGTTADSRNCPRSLRNAMEMSFLEFYDFYESTVKENLYLDKNYIWSLFEGHQITYNYASILKRLAKIKENLLKKQKQP